MLGYDLDRCHLAVIAWADSENEVAQLERLADADLRACGATIYSATT
ncbi:hypothetical protein SAMN05421630_110221 [Prauserella marina]|uniref:Uncharacterized protein n=1 Tax=Prauserella marina TaxID=530584 RepID=A0A1G6W7G8_9PSEU|nr:hypothetical protein [Prauserella marina]PWV74046.1 hypothetical protein DES30_108220 [Prauserella marina]SDD61653.1 hypothetical protein SAMN05421630_110221 [Prauserella marina]